LEKHNEDYEELEDSVDDSGSDTTDEDTTGDFDTRLYEVTARYEAHCPEILFLFIELMLCD